MLQRLGFPTVGRHGRFVTAMAVDAVGSGVFMPVSVLLFLATTDLSLVQVGAAISLASLVSLPAGPLLGSLVDRYGAKRVLLVGNLLQATGFLAYLVSDSFLTVFWWTAVVAVGRTAFWGSYGAIVVAISSPGERERWFGFLGALRNLGFAVGGLVSGLAITVGSVAAYDAVVLANAVSYVAAFGLLLAVPSIGTATTKERGRTPGGWGVVLRDRPYLLLMTCQTVYALASMVLVFGLPVYATSVLGLAGWVTGAIFTINTLMIGLGQGLVVNAMTGRRRWRVLVAMNLVYAASYLLFLGARPLPAAAAVVTVLAGAVVFTVGEMLGGPVHSALGAEAAPDHLRGRYYAVGQLSWNVANTVAPVLLAWLLDAGPSVLWLVLGALSLVGAGLCTLLGARMPLARALITNQAADAVT